MLSRPCSEPIEIYEVKFALQLVQAVGKMELDEAERAELLEQRERIKVLEDALAETQP